MCRPPPYVPLPWRRWSALRNGFRRIRTSTAMRRSEPPKKGTGKKCSGRGVPMWSAEAVVESAVTAEAVWQIWTDVEHWKTWNPQVLASKLNGPFEVGSTGMIKPKGAPKAAFTMIGVQPERRWANRTRLPLATLDYIHELQPAPTGISIRHCAQLSGPLSGLFGIVMGKKLKGDMPQAVRNLAQKAGEVRAAGG
ncbi:MAG: SRPBCC family protein [Dehalococcoidia bacterium]